MNQIVKKTKNPQIDRSPLASYEQAVWLLARAQLLGKVNSAGIAFAAEMVADMFWINDDKVRGDVLKALRDLGETDLPAWETH